MVAKEQVVKTLDSLFKIVVNLPDLPLLNPFFHVLYPLFGHLALYLEPNL